MESEQFKGPQDLINKMQELTHMLAIMGKITGDIRLQFLAQMFLTSFVACNNKDHIAGISQKIIEFVDEQEMKENAASAIEKLKNKEICMN